MTKTDYLEIYKQRYETFRHLDRLQWQMLQIAVGAASVILVVLARNDSELEWWMFTVFGVMLVLFGITMRRIRHGLNKNNDVLRKAAQEIGDDWIPDNSKKWYKSIATVIANVFIFIGIVLILISIGCILTYVIH